MPSMPPTHNAGDRDDLQRYARLSGLVQQAQIVAGKQQQALGLVYPCDTLAMHAAQRILHSGLARPVLIGPGNIMARVADAAGVDLAAFECVESSEQEADAAAQAVALARKQVLQVLMKGALHTDTLMLAIVNKSNGLRGESRMSHAFVFDLPGYHKLLTVTDCVVNIAPDLKTKRDIVSNALGLLHQLGLSRPKVALVSAVETVNPAIPATLDAQALVQMAQQGAWPNALVQGPFGFDNAISAEAARIKGIDAEVAGAADLLLMPDLNAGNILYKSFTYIGGGECAGLVLGARVPVVLTSRADSSATRMASVALAVLSGAATPAHL